MQTSKWKSLVIGQDHPAIITFDMALYEKAIQLLYVGYYEKLCKKYDIKYHQYSTNMESFG